MINVFGASLTDAELSAVRGPIEKSWMGMGTRVREFENSLTLRLGLNGLVMVDSGSNALFLAVRLLNLPPNSRIILPSFTWVACANAILLAGHIPVFADVDIHTHNLTPETVGKVLTKDVKAIMTVHYAGKPCDMDGFKTFGLPVIEDAAHAVDSYVGDKACGSMGDVGIYSFDSVKNLATPEGGAVTGNSDILDRAREYRFCGISKSGFANRKKDRWWEHDIKHIWPKMLPNDVSASIGLVQLSRLDQLQARRREIWERYSRELDGLNLPVGPGPGEKHSYFTYLVRVKKGRDDLAKYLLDNTIYTTLRYHPLHLNGIYGSNVSLPVCELLNEQGLNLPLHPGLSDDDVDKVIKLVRAWKK